MGGWAASLRWRRAQRFASGKLVLFQITIALMTRKAKQKRKMLPQKNRVFWCALSRFGQYSCGYLRFGVRSRTGKFFIVLNDLSISVGNRDVAHAGSWGRGMRFLIPCKQCAPEKPYSLQEDRGVFSAAVPGFWGEKRRRCQRYGADHR